MKTFDNITSALREFALIQEKASAYNHALGLLSLDSATAAPPESWEGRGKTSAILAELLYNLYSSQDTSNLLSYLEEHAEDLEAIQQRQLHVLRRERDHLCKIPKQKYLDYQILLNDAFPAWLKAKQSSDFSCFEPYLEKIVEYNREAAQLYEPDREPYEVLVGLYEEGTTLAALDSFFSRIRAVIVPLLKKVQTVPQVRSDFLDRAFAIEKQRLLSDYLMDMLQLDKRYCSITESEHPFTTNFNNRDVRITTHYYENAFASSMYSVIHEGGHALYELQTDDIYNYTCLSGGVSMGIHESQSRLFENMIGRSREFIHAVFPKLKELFPSQLSDVSEEDLWKAVNKAEPSLIRTEADELTYSLHVMVRYEIEKELIRGTLPVSQIPQRWNELYKEYLGIDVPNDSAGCLQDSHWSGGSIGYFPSYALGSAYSAQFLAGMQEDIPDIQKDIAAGDLTRVNQWLKEHIHKYASFKTPGQIINDAAGGFDPAYYTDYLTRKYTELYGI